MPPQQDSAKLNQTEQSLKILEQRVGSLEKWLKRLLGASGLTLASVITFAFFLGGMYTKVSDSSTKMDKLYGVVAVDKDSLQARTAVMENKLSSIDTKLASMDVKLSDLLEFRAKTTVTVRPVPSPTPQP